MIEKYNNSLIPKPSLEDDIDNELKDLAKETYKKVDEYMEVFNFSNALEEIWKLIRRTNKYVDETMPWILAKENNKERLDTVLYNLAESLRTVAILINPFMTNTSKTILNQLGVTENIAWEDASVWGKLESGLKINKQQIMFPRLDIEKELVKLEKAN
ncbi:class I tRNA ligase family protein, partial [Vibrio parahaemolyticus]|nr:class I tRNA ligase family protein [Vibrio parahaemolyticus]